MNFKMLKKITIKRIESYNKDTTKIIDIDNSNYLIRLPVKTIKQFLDIHGINFLCTYFINSTGQNVVLGLDKIKQEFKIRTIKDVVDKLLGVQEVSYE